MGWQALIGDTKNAGRGSVPANLSQSSCDPTAPHMGAYGNLLSQAACEKSRQRERQKRGLPSKRVLSRFNLLRLLSLAQLLGMLPAQGPSLGRQLLTKGGCSTQAGTGLCTLPGRQSQCWLHSMRRRGAVGASGQAGCGSQPCRLQPAAGPRTIQSAAPKACNLQAGGWGVRKPSAQPGAREQQSCEAGEAAVGSGDWVCRAARAHRQEAPLTASSSSS